MADDPTGSSNQSVTHIGNESAFTQLLADEDRVLVDFYADWCGPCQMMAPVVDEFAAESDAAIVKVDVEELPQIATRYDVQSIPTFLVFRDEEPVDRLVGMQEKDLLEQALE